MAGPEPSQRFLTGLGYEIGPPVFDPLQQVNLSLCHHRSMPATMPAVEVIWPAAAGTGPLDSLLRTRPEGLVYHMAFTTPSLAVSLGAIKAAGLRLVELSAPRPAILFDGAPVSFHMVRGLGLIEIIETAGAAGPVP